MSLMNDGSSISLMTCFCQPIISRFDLKGSIYLSDEMICNATSPNKWGRDPNPTVITDFRGIDLVRVY